MDNNITLDPDFLDESSRNNIEDYICCICQLIPYSDTAIEEENCGHLFCYICINEWLQKSQNCPFCKETITQRSVKNKNKLVYRHLINLIVLCQEDDCKWKGTLKEYYEHLKTHNNYYFKNNNNIISFELYKYYKATIHEHPLKFLDLTMSNGWGCNGRYLPSKCLSGITGFGQSKEIKRFRCMQCNFDLCELCMKEYLDCKYEIKENNSNNRGLYLLNKKYYTSAHKHPLTFLDKSRDNGWRCNGRDLNEKCFSGITDFNQSKNVARFRCEKCDFDLCENCMNHYKQNIVYVLNQFYKTTVHPHPLKFLDKTKDNGWFCDGRKLKEKCLSRINDFQQTKGFERFRCDKCDFDLCRNCMDFYFQKNK